MEIIKYINNPELLDEQTLPQVKELLKEYPHFQTLHLLLLKNLDNLRLTSEFNETLRRSALYIGDRKKLYFLLNTKNQTSVITEKVIVEKAVEEKLEVPETVVTESKVEIEEEFELQEESIIQVEPDLKESYQDELILIDELQQIDTVAAYSEQNSESTYDIFGGEDLLLIEGYPEESEVEEKQELEVIKVEEEKEEDIVEEKEEVIEKKEEIKDQPKIQIEEDSPIQFSAEYNLEEILPEIKEPESSSDVDIDLIDNFIKSSPKIVPDKTKMQENVDISKSSVQENDEFITERLAEIYIEQKLYSKAIYTYEKLCLKFPKKSTYFEARIEDLKILINK